MASKITNCAQFRESMADAADAALSNNLRADFDAHLRDCAACREEFRRAQALRQAINDGLSASVAAEPSPQLIANVLRRIGEQQDRAPAWWSRSPWLTAASACAALAIFLFAARTLHRFNRPLPNDAPSPIVASSTPSHSAASPNRSPVVESATSAPPRKPAPLFARHASSRELDHPAPEPEIIVEPGQMEAVFEFAAALQSGQIDGAKLLADQRQVAEPLEIKPLTIAPLKIAALADDAAPPASGGGESGNKNFVAGRSD
jgi:Putative zinc-finger